MPLMEWFVSANPMYSNSVTTPDPRVGKTIAPQTKGGSAIVRRFPAASPTSATAAPLSAGELQALRQCLQELLDESGELSAINASRVVDLHHRIVAGDYGINTSRIAEKLAQLEAVINRD